MKCYEGAEIKIWAYQRGGYYILRITKYIRSFVSTRSNRKAHAEEGWSPPFEKKFESATQANTYFKAIKMTKKKLSLVSDEPNKYIDCEGIIREYSL